MKIQVPNTGSVLIKLKNKLIVKLKEKKTRKNGREEIM